MSVTETNGVGKAGADALSPEQLAGRACRTCGDTHPPLHTVGHTYTNDREGGRLGWPLVACSLHAGGRR